MSAFSGNIGAPPAQDADSNNHGNHSGGSMFGSTLVGGSSRVNTNSGESGGGGGGGGENRFFQMLVRETGGGKDGKRTTTTNATSDINLSDFPRLGPLSSSSSVGGGGGFSTDTIEKTYGGAATSGADFAAALSRAATGQSIGNTSTSTSGMNGGAGGLSVDGIGGMTLSSRDSNGGNTAVSSSLRRLAQEEGLSSSEGARFSSLAGSLSELALSGGSTTTSTAAERFEMAKEDFPALPEVRLNSGGTMNSGFLDATSFSGSGGFGGNGNTTNVVESSGSGALLREGSTILPSSSYSGRESSSGILGVPVANNPLDPPGVMSTDIASRSSAGFLSDALQPRQATSTTSSTPMKSSPNNATTGGAVSLLSSSSSSKDGGAGQGQSTTTTATDNILTGEYGLLGLLSIFRVPDADHNVLALGSDLTHLGLNLNSSEPLYKNFAGPFAGVGSTLSVAGARKNNKTDRRLEPVYQIPSCYYIPSTPALKTGHLSKFQLETLFYIFYSFTQDVLQAHAAQELYSRNWKYHVDMKLWFAPAVSKDEDDLNAAFNNGQQQQQPPAPQQLIYFDTSTWEKKTVSSLTFEQLLNKHNGCDGNTSLNGGSTTSGGINGTVDVSFNSISRGFLSDHEVQINANKAR